MPVLKIGRINGFHLVVLMDKINLIYVDQITDTKQRPYFLIAYFFNSTV